MKPIDTREIALDLIINSSDSYAYIVTRNWLSNTILSYGQNSFYSPPLSHESTLFLDFIAIAVQKNFKFVKEFNKLLVNLIIK
jgi:hypothetical protein